MNFKPALRAKQRGTVLITVILMVALAALIATDIGYRQKLDIKRTSSFLSRDQAFFLLLAAENVVKQGLILDLKQDNSPNNPVFKDVKGKERWDEYNGQPIPVEGGVIQGELIDLQSRFNINSIMDDDSDIQAAQRALLKKLMTLKKVPDPNNINLSADMLIERLVDWLDPDSDVTGTDGMEDLDYLTPEGAVRPAPYRTANQLMFDASELLLIEGFTAQNVKDLQDLICFLPVKTNLNLNTAEDDIITAIGGFNQELKTTREVGDGFDTLADLFQKAYTPTAASAATPANSPGSLTGSQSGNSNPTGAGGAAQQPVGNFSVNSEYFLLEAKAIINGKAVIMESIIYRPAIAAGSSNSDIKVKTISRKLIDPLKRV